tara:strand:+ start:634 stop:1563 length:930 start_codon:yes stop_codon:yes gene_type:complete
MKILVTSTSFQDTPGEHHNLLKSQKWDCSFLRGPLKEKNLLKIIHNYDAIICGDDDYTSKVLKKGKSGNLKILSKYGVGLDKIDLIAAKNLKIKVTNCPGINQVSVSEHVIALLLTFEKNIHHQAESVRNYSWFRMIGNEIMGKRIGIVGCGNIGKEVVKRCLALGMIVNIYDLNKDQDFLNKYPEVNFFTKLESIVEESEIITLHLPLNEHTEKIINQNLINKFMTNDTVIINTARAGLVDINSLSYALKNKKIRGYLTDVLHDEPITRENKLVGLKNVIITPHIGSRTYQNVVKQGLMAVNNLIKFL